ncbi:MAG: site-2 protease family protein [Thermoplasmatota archaeon]
MDATPTGDAASDPRDLTLLRQLVEMRFPVYDVQSDEHVVAFFVNVDPATVERNFESLRTELREKNLIPLLKYQGGEHSIFVVHKPERRFRSERVNLVLFALTWITTTIAGASAWFFYANSSLAVSKLTTAQYFGMLFSATNLANGFLYFALPLMLILGIHEMGHYVMTKRHGMAASLPFFIPLPPFLSGVEIGTLGAFISMREPMPNKKALLDIGVAGPIAGFVVAIPVLLIGMVLMKTNPVIAPATAGSTVTIGTPLLYDWLAAPFQFTGNEVIHPTAFAGWVGLFVTAINLLPAGQLDGGHMASAMFGDKARYLSYAVVAVLLVLGIGVPPLHIAAYGGWLVFALLIAFLGIQHPPTLNNVTELDRGRFLLGLATFAIFVVCFTPVPYAAT